MIQPTILSRTTTGLASGSISVSPKSTWDSSPSRIFTVTCDSGFLYWYWTIVSALRNFGPSSSSAARSWNSLPMKR